MVVVVVGSWGEGTLLTNDQLPVKIYWKVVLIICKQCKCDTSLATHLHINFICYFGNRKIFMMIL